MSKKKKKKNNKKNKIIIPIISIVLVVLLAGSIGLVYVLANSNKEVIYEDNMSLKIGDEVPSKVTYTIKEEKKEAKIKWDALKLEENKVYIAGKYKGKFIVDEKEYNVTLKVIDDTNPTINEVKDFIITIGERVDFISTIKVTDDSHSEVKTIVDGEYDFGKTGEYNLKYIATDASGNKTEAPFKLAIKEEEKAPTNGSYTVGKTSKGYDIVVDNGVYYINGILIANKTYNLPDSYAPGGLLQELNDAFARLQADASAAGHNIYIISGYRSYWDQDYIYNNYVARDGQALADTYSARPGHSEHQTGLAVDVNSLETWFGDTPEGIWLKENCSKYGFIIRYPYGKDNITGYQYEPWHIRYVGDIASELYQNGEWTTLEEYLGIDSYYH